MTTTADRPLVGATSDVNAAFDAEKGSQIQFIQDARERYQKDLAAFESGEAQAALDAEIAQRVADGKIELIGNGRYRVTDPGSWDVNETFQLQTARKPGELYLIEPESGLDFNEAGEAQGLFAEPEWHKLGIIAQTSDITEAVKLAGLDYDVLQVPVTYTDHNGVQHIDPRAFENFRSDTGAPLGVVGKIYQPFQNRTAFQFLQDLVDDDKATIAAAAPLDGGRRVFVTVKLADDVVLDIPGLPEGDLVLPYVAVINSHDGSGKIKAMVTPWRVRCGNTERFAVRDAWTSWGTRHTSGAEDRVAEAQRQLGLAVKYLGRFKDEEEILARADLTTREANKVLAELEAELWPLPDAVAEGSRKLTAREKGTRDRRHGRIKARFRDEAGQVGSSLYSVERAFTGDLDWGVPRKLRGAAILEGADDGRKTQAHRLLIQRTR